MVVPLWSHMTDLCLLRGVQAAGQSRPSLSLHPSLCLALSRSLALEHTRSLARYSRLHACVRA